MDRAGKPETLLYVYTGVKDFIWRRASVYKRYDQARLNIGLLQKRDYEKLSRCSEDTQLDRRWESYAQEPIGTVSKII